MRKTNRGGFRNGGGRKELGGKKKEPITIYVPREEIESLGGKEQTRRAALAGVSFHLTRV